MTSDAARVVLEGRLPAVSLILGPPGSGKGALARHLIGVHKVMPSDVMFIFELTMDVARTVTSGAQYGSWSQGGLKVFVISLDGASEQAQNALLKTLEESPDSIRFILTASGDPLPTIVSRSQVFRVGSAQGLSGREFDPSVRSVVSAAVRAAAEGEWEVMPGLARGWTVMHSLCLNDWSREAVTGRWLFYTYGFAPGVTRDQATAVWKLTSQQPDSQALSWAALGHAFARRSS